MQKYSQNEAQDSFGNADVTEVQRLESLWNGEFGDQYTQRNQNAGVGRTQFWQIIVQKCAPERVLEVGCNVGANLRPLSEQVPQHSLYGIDINETALSHLRRGELSGVNSLWASARDLPFKDEYFDLVFTMGVLIHQPEASLPFVMSEIVRCSKRYVLCGEYADENTVEVPYRGETGALFRRPYGAIYQLQFPHLKLIESGFLGRESGWDDVTFWLFEK
ncbi:MAG TPA: pseudaminic acid biosynthesis-associated methylase [Abditibacterium sp.]|jgi:pseudaminic acid biosynthesis-associated methylase